MFFAASLESDGLPFAVQRRESAIEKKNKSRIAMFGCLRGKYRKYKLADDFDVPLDDFKEYMR
jgi:hypothetical protein